jgi:hypothetical protein
MKKIRLLTQCSLILALATVLSTGCQSDKKTAATQTIAPVAAQTTTPAVAAAATTATTPPVETAPAAIRIDAGTANNYTDAKGNVWLADQSFVGGDMVDRGDIDIDNTQEPAIYRTEHWGMTSFSHDLPNGKYVVKLHFAETADSVEGPGGRVFNFSVNGQEFKNFDVWVKAGGPHRAYIETIPVTITNGKLEIIFTVVTEYPEINGIEIIPAT